MPVRLPRGKALRTEKPVIINPVPTDYRPADSIPYRVTDLDMREGWKGIATKNGVDAKRLIQFNFNTNNPDEVNWYLRRNTGCDTCTDDRLNWVFSSTAHPGVIYIPVHRIDYQGTIIEGKRTVSPIAAEFEGPSSPLDTANKVFDVMQVLEMAGLGLPLGPVLGIVVMTAQQFVLVGSWHEAPLVELRKKYMLEGLSLGIVLAADGRSPTWIQNHGFVMYAPVNNIHYPQYGKQFQGIYNTSLAAGIVHGQQFNTVASKNLFMFIQGKMTDYAKSIYSGNPDNWSSSKWVDYYNLCAEIYKPKLKLK